MAGREKIYPIGLIDDENISNELGSVTVSSSKL